MKSFWGKLLVIFIFGILPVVSLYLLAHRMLARQRDADLVEAKAKLRLELIRSADASLPGRFYFQLIESLLQKIEDQTVLPAAKAELIKKAQTFCGSDLAVYLFDTEGTLQNLPAYAPSNRFVVNKLWDILAETPEYRKGDEQRQLKRLQILLGAEASAGVVKNHEGQLLSLKKKRADGFLYWQRFSPGSLSGALVIVFPLLTPHEILGRIYGSHPDEKYQLAFWNHDSQNPLYTKGKILNPDYFRTKTEKSSTEYLIEANRLWLTINTSSGVFLGSVPISNLTGSNRNGMLNFLLAITFAIFTILLFSRDFDLRKIYLSTGSKLLALLLVAIVIPTAGLMLTGVTAIATHEKVLWSRLEKEKVTRLSAIEDDFAEEERNFGMACESLYRLVLDNYSAKSYAKAAKSMVDSGQGVRVDLTALDGESISVLNRGSWFEGLEKSIGAYGRYLIEKQLAHRSDHEKITVKRKPDAVLNDAFASPEFGFGQISKAPGKIHNVRFGLNELLWYWNLIDVPGHPAALISIFQAKNIARLNYLQKFTRSNKTGREIISVFDTARQKWLGKNAEYGSEAEELIRTVTLTDKPEQRRISAVGREWLALAYPAQALAPYSLMIMTDERVVRDQTEFLYRLLALGLIVIFAVALLIARLLAEAFVKPVKELDRGMALVQKRQPDARVDIDAGDEFGELGAAFNLMVDELNEMQLAKSVQEALFPQEKLEIPGFDTALFNQAATDLGGDYCDYVKLDTHRYLFLIGDVSGHGTSAALCMAMAKAAVFKACRDGFDFIDLPGRISTLLLQTLSRKKMMTMLFMLLNTEHCTLQLVNAGHNWPLVIRRDGSVEEIELVGMPLGIRKSPRKPEMRTLQLNQGDALFSYTDALIECQSLQGEVYGHEAMYLELARGAKLSPAETVAHIKSVWDLFRAGGVQEDDLTMLVIKNLTREPANGS